MSIKALVPLADGVEEMEAVIVIDVFRRAGWDVSVVGLTDREITASRGVRLKADCLLSEVDTASLDVLAFAGGNGGTEALCACPEILSLAEHMLQKGKLLGAICASPLALSQAGLLKGRKVTSYPGVQEKLEAGEVVNEPVVVDDNLITSQGPGTSFDYALAFVEKLEGAEKANELRSQMCL